MSPELERFAATIRRRLDELKTNPRRAAINAGMNERSIRAVLEGHAPKLERIAEICHALDMEFTFGKASATASEGDLAREPRQRRGGAALRGPPLTAAGVTGEQAETPARVGSGDAAAGFSPDGCVLFDAKFLSRWGLDPERCLAITMADDAMAPTILSGCSILGDMHRLQRVPDQICLLFHDGEFIVRRARQDNKGRWWIVCDNPLWQSVPWAEQARIVAQVVWSARILL